MNVSVHCDKSIRDECTGFIELTVIRDQTARILYEKVRKCAMNVGADPLTRLCSTKDSDDGNFGHVRALAVILPDRDLRIKACWRCLVVVNAVEP